MLNVFIGHPIGGNVKENIRLVEKVCERIFTERPQVQPLAPYLLALRFLNDDKPAERLRGVRMNREFFYRKMVDELWLFGPRISNGMWEEVGWARKLRIPVVPMNRNVHLELIRTELKSGDLIQLQGCGPSSLSIATFVGVSEQNLPVVHCVAGAHEELEWGDIINLAPVGVPLESPRRYH